MPKRADLQNVVILGAGPIVIGQACEFDYAGTQSCKALREDRLRTVLINSNPATIMTDPETADTTYIEPVTPTSVRAVIEKELTQHPGESFAILPTMGGTSHSTWRSPWRTAGIWRRGASSFSASYPR